MQDSNWVCLTLVTFLFPSLLTTTVVQACFVNDCQNVAFARPSPRKLRVSMLSKSHAMLCDPYFNVKVAVAAKVLWAFDSQRSVHGG